MELMSKQTALLFTNNFKREGFFYFLFFLNTLLKYFNHNYVPPTHFEKKIYIYFLEINIIVIVIVIIIVRNERNETVINFNNNDNGEV